MGSLSLDLNFLNIMKTKIATLFILILAVVSLSLAQPKSDKTQATTLQEIHAELRKTQAELQQTQSRISALEQKVTSLQQANAKLDQEIKTFGQPRLVPLESK